MEAVVSNLVRVASLDEGALWRVTFGASKGNILDGPLMAALTTVFEEAAHTPSLKAICLEGSGDHFSFGASVQEHFPEYVEAMLANIRGLALALMNCHVTTLAAVRGRCLGGGLELASLCHRVFADPEATFGQPEIALGVFAPIASVVLPGRVGRGHAEDLCLTGRIVTASEARSMGLVDEVAHDPSGAALAWARTHLAHRSGTSLRFAVRAVRARLAERVRVELPALEAFYLRELMDTHDATEGLRAFLDKRAPLWKDA